MVNKKTIKKDTKTQEAKITIVAPKPWFKKGKEENTCCSGHYHHSGTGAIYGLGFIGSAIYFISTATGFWMGVLGVLKSIVWPVFLIFGLFKLIGM